ncbi:sigma factor-like helix-turn-helix DNA-binding protein [Enterococcus gilvus]|uniref:sigma factor-like helix-turn-helix DNA-binding protein n=1 Tax=Enterococcus gilvus TaxID=160453 RepID=UPI0028D6F0CF|nr:sigma factor-like helix-turn-helix DNA-binding protein [Enterococcus gilvus]
MNKENEIAYLFIKYIQQTLINEKRKYIRNSIRKQIPIMGEEYLLENLENEKEALLETADEKDYQHLEDFIEDINLTNAIVKLTNIEKYILYKKFVEKETDKTLAKEFGISSQAVSKKKRNIIKKLRLSLKKE